MLIGYARVSTLDQDPTLQLDALEAAGCEKIFIEHMTGAKRDRPELNAALSYLRDGDTLVVWKLDRLARSLKQLIETVETMDGQGVGFKSLTENIDTTTAGGLLVFHLFGALAQFERALIQERTTAGLAAARARGRVGGRKPKLSDADVKAARAMLRDESITAAQVAKQFGVSVGTLYRYLPAAKSEAVPSL